MQPRCRVLAFEPFLDNFRLLQANLRSASAQCVEPHFAALSGDSGTSWMIAVGTRSQDHRIAFGEPTPGDQQAGHDAGAVPTLSLADVFRLAATNKIAMFKCDIEGSEAEPSHLSAIERFAVEWHEHLRPATLALLQEKLQPTHDLAVSREGDGKWGMLHASLR